jgi:hypothetical protein
MGTIIELADLSKDSNRLKCKVRPTLVMTLEKAGFFTLPREKEKGFIQSVIKKAGKSIGPNQYKRPDYNLFVTDGKKIHFSTAKGKKESCFTELSKRKAFIPGPNKYETIDKLYKTIGTIKV